MNPLDREAYNERKKANERHIALSHEAQRIRTLADGRPLNVREINRLTEIGAEMKRLEDLL